MKDLKIKIPIYNSLVRYIVTDDFINEYKRQGAKYDDTYNHCHGVSEWINGINTIMIKEKYENDWSVIAHEVLHATNRILEHVGVEVNTINDEAQAYLLSYVIKEIQKHKK